MKGACILAMLFFIGLWTRLVLADSATYNSRLETIKPLAEAKRCYTLQQGPGLTSVEFARLRAICWKAQLGDAWAARNPVYGSTTLGQLERPKTAEEKSAEAAAAAQKKQEEAAAAALAAQKTSCEAIGSSIATWNDETKSCSCVSAGYTLRDNQCFSPAEIRTAAIKASCDADPGKLLVPDPDNADLWVSCSPSVIVSEVPLEDPAPALDCDSCHAASTEPRLDVVLRNFGMAPQRLWSPVIVDTSRNRNPYYFGTEERLLNFFPELSPTVVR